MNSRLAFAANFMSITLSLLASPSLSQADVRCEWLFASSAPRQINDYRPSNAVVPADAQGAKTKIWLQNSFWDIVRHFPFSNRWHSSKFLQLDRALRDSNFHPEPVFVREHSPGIYEVRVRYVSPNPTNSAQRMVVEASIFYMKARGMEPDGAPPRLLEQNSTFKVVGLTSSTTDFASRDRTRQTNRTDFNQRFFDLGRRFDPQSRHAWTDHMRKVLHDVLVPLALNERSIAEVGIGFEPESVLAGRGYMNGTPRLTITRNPNLRSTSDITDALLPVNAVRPTELDGVMPVVGHLDKATQSTILIRDRENYLVVFDELLDQNPNGSMFVVDRQTGERRELYYRPSLDAWTFEKPAPGEVSLRSRTPVSFEEKLNPRLRDRIALLARGGANPRIRVTITQFSIRGERRVTGEKILAVTEIQALSLDPNVISIIERLN